MLAAVKPPPDLKISEWAQKYRLLSPESSAEPGRWNNDRTPYLVGVMDAMCDPDVQDVVFMASSQVGKSETALNIIGYGVDQDPCPMLLMLPTLTLAESFSKDRLAPMFRDVPALQQKAGDLKSRKSGNTLLHKQFAGGHITLCGANSPASLSSRPVKWLICDEPDRFPPSAGTEGDPINLGKKRTTTFVDTRKHFLSSTPTIKDFSRIEFAYNQSDQRRFYVPCPHCGEYQVLRFGGEGVRGGLRWQKEESEAGTIHYPETAVYVCEENGCIITDADKQWMLENGEWIAEAEFTGTAGFHINQLYSPWVTFEKLVKEWVEAKDHPETLKVFVNTALGEVWEEKGKKISIDGLINRKEHWDKTVAPDGVLVVTAGVDVQDNRLECEIKGWGVDDESWGLGYHILYGDPSLPDVWEQLDDVLETQIEHAAGVKLPVACCCIDSQGHHTDAVYTYCRERDHKRIYAIKGVSGMGKPLVGRPKKKSKKSKSAKHGIQLILVGTDTAKELIYSLLKITKPGPGYQHFHAEYDDEYFHQLTAEKMIKKFRDGRPVREWKLVRSNKRNEALDVTVYNLAALRILNPNWPRIKARHEARIKRLAEKEKTDTPSTSRRRSRARRGGFVRGN